VSSTCSTPSVNRNATFLPWSSLAIAVHSFQIVALPCGYPTWQPRKLSAGQPFGGVGQPFGGVGQPFGGVLDREGDTYEVNNGTPTVRLELDSRPECLTLVRGALVGIGETLAFDPELLDDVKTAVSEACSNVVLHAYGGVVGPLAVQVAVGHDRVEAAVQDRGSGIHTVSSSDDRMGVGLAVITALSARAEFISTPGVGTEVRMAFNGPVADVPCAAKPLGHAAIDGSGPDSALDGRVLISLSTPDLLGGVLGRVARGMAAAANFSVDRIQELSPLADRLASHACTATADPPLELMLSASNRRLDLAIGPFRSGSSAGLDTKLGALVAEIDVDRADESETLRLVVSESRA
jgi:serine/threonine-protein kinase RsbW